MRGRREKQSDRAVIKLALMSSRVTGETPACEHPENLRPGTFRDINNERVGGRGGSQ